MLFRKTDMASTAKNLFDRIFSATSPEDELNKIILSEKQPESDSVEYKVPPELEENPGSQKARDQKQQLADAKVNWSKALSAFANTSGGLLIWGVKCSRNSDGIDEPSGFDLVKDSRLLREKLIALHTQANSDFVEGVDIKEVEFQGGGSVLVCYIPEGANKPYRADYAGKAYYMRIQSNSVIMPHAMLRTMFYPRVSPKFELTLTASIRHEGNGQHIDCVFNLMNRGTSTADDVIVRVKPRYPDPKALRSITDTWQFKGPIEMGFDQIFIVSSKKAIHPHLPVDEFSFTTVPFAYWDSTKKIAFHLDIYGRNQSEVTKMEVAFSAGMLSTGMPKQFPVLTRAEEL